ncbi:MAG TPA: helix-turn-helix domain-containing protein [Streptosporangiaceae bacterium]
MPRLWDETIEAHRHQVRDAILDAAAALVLEHGRRAVTMSQIAERAGIGRATLYKYFTDIDAILHAWHARQIIGHLQQLADVRDRAGDPGQRLEAVLRTYALLVHRTRGHHDVELVTFLHQDQHLADARRKLHDLVRGLIADAAEAGHVRADIVAGELTGYCLSALGAAAGLPSEAAVRRLVQVTLAGLRPAG